MEYTNLRKKIVYLSPKGNCIAGRGIRLAHLDRSSRANRHNIILLEATFKNIVVDRPALSEKEPQHLCLDKSCDSAGVRELL